MVHSFDSYIETNIYKYCLAYTVKWHQTFFNEIKLQNKTKVCAIDGEAGNHDKRILFYSVVTFLLSVFSLIVQQVL